MSEIARIYSDSEIAAALGHVRRVLIEGPTPLHPLTRRALRALNTAVIELAARRGDAAPVLPQEDDDVAART